MFTAKAETADGTDNEEPKKGEQVFTHFRF